VVLGTGTGAAVAGRVGAGAAVGRDRVGAGAAVGRDRVGAGAAVGPDGTGRGRAVVVDGTGRGCRLVVGAGAAVSPGTERDGTGAGAAGLRAGTGRGPPSANALVAATVPRAAAPVTIAARIRTRFAGIKVLQTKRWECFAWKDA
jgi:hypothetical protein